MACPGPTGVAYLLIVKAEKARADDNYVQYTSTEESVQ
jgi:hypothetical protein